MDRAGVRRRWSGGREEVWVRGWHWGWGWGCWTRCFEHYWPRGLAGIVAWVGSGVGLRGLEPAAVSQLTVRVWLAIDLRISYIDYRIPSVAAPEELITLPVVCLLDPVVSWLDTYLGGTL